MFHVIMKRYGITAGLLFCILAIIGLTISPVSCQLNSGQSASLQKITVPAASILSAVAVKRGWIEPGDKVVIQRGVAVLTSEGDTGTKLFNLAELGMEHALSQGLIEEGDVIELKSEDVAVITHEVPSAAVPAPDGPANPLLPPP